jgi:tetratricopeptide (TPR) repeat protein
MTPVSAISPAGPFAYTTVQSTQLESLAQRAVTHGVDLFIDRKYDEAIKEFQRAIGLAPNSSLAVDAYNQIGQAHTQKNDSQNAIDAYRQAIRLDPTRSDTRVALGNVYYFESRYQEARQEYEQAVRLDPGAANRFSLGQAYLAEGNYTEAEIQFKRVRDMAPNEPGGNYGLGQVLAAQGRHQEAIKTFQSAIDIQRDFWDAYVEMGYSYVDSGQFEEAGKLVETLTDEDITRAATLNGYIDQKTPPKMVATLSEGSFPTSLSRGTLVSILGEYLANAGASQTFSMIFQFNKPMDRSSVENVLNWSISRAVGTGLGDAYNFGLGNPDTEITLAPHPVGVNYDAAYLTATVWFELHQNAGADGTLDPSHVQFTFSGQDSDGLPMSSQADQYTGFSGFA